MWPPVYFGEEHRGQTGNCSPTLGAKTVFFCIYDKGVAIGFSAVVQTLKESGLRVVEFDGVLPNPERGSLIREAASLARKAGAARSLPSAAPSSIDTAKAVAVLLTNPSPLINIPDRRTRLKYPANR